MKPALLLAAVVVLRAADSRPAPDLTFTTPQSGQRTISQLAGKVVALEFAYSTCQPCKAASERLQKLAREFGTRDFEAYDIAFDPNASVMSESASANAPGLPLSWAIAHDVRNFLGYTPSDRLSVPQLALIDRAGQIRYQTALSGNDPLRTEATLRARILELLSPAPASSSALQPRKTRK